MSDQDIIDGLQWVAIVGLLFIVMALVRRIR